jgi:hypothetical protein
MSTQQQGDAPPNPAPPGARAPTNSEIPPTSDALPAPATRGWRLAIQIVGFVLGLGALGACVYLALSNPQYREQLTKLRDAPTWLPVSVVALSMVVTALAGLVFCCVLRPVRSVRAIDCVAVNGLCTLLANLPFKLSLVARVAIHVRRDKLPFSLVLAWLAATLAVIVCSSAPPLLASLWIGAIDWRWWAVSISGVVLLTTLTIVTARALASDLAWERFTAIVGAFRPLGGVARSDFARNLHGSMRMLASPTWIPAAVLLRGADVGVQALRFVLAAQAVGVEISFGQAIIAGSVYFLLQSFSPAGTLGVREGGTAGVMALLHADGMVVVVLAVGMASAVADVLMGVWSAVHLRVDRLLGGAR